MFNRLRLRLTVIYLFFAALMVALLSWSSYNLLNYYFQNFTDLGLKYRMAQEYNSLRLQLPPDLQMAVTTWQAGRPHQATAGFPPSINPETEDSEGEVNKLRGANELSEQERFENNYEGELASIFVLPLGPKGELLFNPNPINPPMGPNLAAVQAASKGSPDLRTVKLADGTPVRLLTYPMPGGGFAFLQLGRQVNDQARVMERFLIGLLLVGSVAVVIFGAASWWVAGRSTGPAQYAMEQQRIFVANASHELRTPLAIIRASVEIAQRQTSNTQNRQMLGEVLGDVDYMNKLVEDLLLLSRLDSQRLVVNPEPLDLARYLPEIGAQAEKLAGREKPNFSIPVATGVLWADPARLKQVILVLLDNAFRHTPAGGTVQLSGQPVGSRVIITVTDSGAGIPPEHLPHVFERFYKVDHSSNEEYRGSGLGLSIAQSLVEAQGGNIRLESKPGKGTTAILTFPLEKAKRR